MTPAMPCKKMDNQHNCLTKVKAVPKNGKGKELKTMYGRKVESHESTRQRPESLRERIRVDIVKDDSRAYAVFTEQGSSASQMTAANVVDVIAELPGCDGQCLPAHR